MRVAKKGKVDIFGLPTDDGLLVRALRSAINCSKSVRNIEAIRWGLTKYWLQGIREFEEVAQDTGSLVGIWGDPSAELRYEEAVSSTQQEIGRLMSLDLRPVVRARGMTLDGVRRGAVGHASLSYLHLDMDYEESKRAFVTDLVHYGTVGIMVEEDPRPVAEGPEPVPGMQAPPPTPDTWTPRFEVIPPWQLLPLPGDVPSLKEVKAVARARWVPLEWLRARIEESSGTLGPQLKLPPASDEGRLLPRAVPFGSPTYEVPFGTVSGAFGTSTGIAGDLERPRELSSTLGSNQIVELIEVWFSLDGRLLDRYLVMVGDYISADVDYRELRMRVPYPIGIARYFEVGGWFGRAYSELRISLNQISERLLRSIVRNVEDMDAFGILMVPRTSMIRRHELLRRRDGGPRMATWEPDIMAPNVQPFAIQPVTSGGLPGEVLKLVSGLEDRVMPQLSVFSPNAPRRIDSQGAVESVEQASNQPRSAVTESVVLAWRTMYRSLLWAARKHYSNAGVIRLVTFDDAVAGVVLDPRNLTLSLDKNALPEPHEVEITVQSDTPRNPQMIVQWLMKALEMQLITQSEFRIQLRKAGLEDMPVGNEGEWGAYQQAQLNNIILFGDGETSGQIRFMPQVGHTDIFLGVITDFMATPRYALASDNVRAAFKAALDRYRSLIPNFPDALPPMEDAMGGAGQPMSAMPPDGGGMMPQMPGMPG